MTEKKCYVSKVFCHTSMFPHVWKAVNISMKPRPNTKMFNSDLLSGLILV